MVGGTCVSSMQGCRYVKHSRRLSSNRTSTMSSMSSIMTRSMFLHLMFFLCLCVSLLNVQYNFTTLEGFIVIEFKASLLCSTWVYLRNFQFHRSLRFALVDCLENVACNIGLHFLVGLSTRKGNHVQDPLKLDMVISFPDHGFHLRFDPWSQVCSQFESFLSLLGISLTTVVHLVGTCELATCVSRLSWRMCLWLIADLESRSEFGSRGMWFCLLIFQGKRRFYTLEPWYSLLRRDNGVDISISCLLCQDHSAMWTTYCIFKWGETRTVNFVQKPYFLP